MVGGGESPTFITSNSEEESKIKFYFLLRRNINIITTVVKVMLN